MKITGIECHVLVDPGNDVYATSSAQDDLVVEVHTDEGITGVGSPTSTRGSPAPA
jgi:L-alanine-DL-glutamate epimerase-like enolase superfamily enzyme